METTTATRIIYLAYTTPCGVTVGTSFDAELDHALELAQDMIGPLTRCCKAAVKADCYGTWRCKGCWSEQPAYMADLGYAALEAAIRDAGCPVVHDCADHAMWQMDLLLDGLSD